jgi:hypothetical protein
MNEWTKNADYILFSLSSMPTLSLLTRTLRLHTTLGTELPEIPELYICCGSGATVGSRRIASVLLTPLRSTHQSD